MPTRPPPSPLDLAGVLAGATVAWTGLVALVLANNDAFGTVPVLALGLLAPIALLAFGWRHRTTFAAVRWGWSDLALVGLCGVLTAVLVVPGFPYLIGDKDPGVYAAHALAIERTGGTAIADPVLEHRDEVPVTNYLDDNPLPARFPAYWVDPDAPDIVRPQFFHLLPSLLATAAGIGGTRAVFNLTPLLAGMSLLILSLAVRRAIGPIAALLAAGLLGANLIQVWHARHPSTELLTQLFAGAASLSVLLAVQLRLRWLAALGGALVAATFLARPDGLLLVVLGGGIAALLLALGVGGRLPVWFLGGLAVALPYPLYQAYRLNRTYMLANDLPDWPLVLGAVGAIAVGAVVIHRVVRPRLDGWHAALVRRTGREDLRVVAAALVGAVTAVLLVVAWFRPDLFDPVMATTLDGRRIPRLDEWNLRKLSWFITLPGLVAMWAGLVLAVARRSWASLWLVILPGALLCPLYVWQAHIESRLMWWGRRFVPVVLPAMAILAAAAVAAALTHTGRGRVAARVVGALAAVFLVVVPVSQSLGVRDHREHGGSVELIDEVAAVSGDEEGVFLWEFPDMANQFDPARVLGGPVWFVHGGVSTLLPEDPTGADIQAYAEAFPDQPLFVVTREDQPLPAMSGMTAEPALRIDTQLAHWEETDFERPDEAISIPLRFTVWAVSGAGS